MNSQKLSPTNSNYDFDAIIVGAGFAGMYMLYRLRNLGLTAQVLEAGDGVGGTWYWNRYPGARCDTESMFYSYQFSNDLQQEWEWTERYPRQPEILKYANHVADRFDLRRDILFGARVISAKWHEKKQIWHIETSTRNQISAQFCIMATGCLSSPNIPKYRGLKTFRGDIFHTGLWPDQHVNFANKSVAILGTGSSGIQVIPEIAKDAKRLYVFQRTANYVVPAHNRPLNSKEVSYIKENYSKLRANARQTYSGNIFETGGPSALAVSNDERSREYEERWQMGGLCFMAAYEDLQVSPEANETAAQFIRNKIKEEVNDINVAQLLSPKNLFGCKRLCVASGYYETFNRKNVNLIDVSETPIDCITPNGVSVDSKEFKVDTIVLATGFDAMTGALKKIDIVICTALIPGKKAPLIIKDTMIDNMQPGSVIYDLAASQGGNSAYTKVNEIVEKNGVKILGDSNILNKLPTSSSTLYAKNLYNFVLNLYDKKNDKININLEDEIIKNTLIK